MSSSFMAGMDMAGGPLTLKKTPLLSSTSQKKVTAVPKTYVFELELGESNDHTYPEFSWTDLVKDAKDKELEEKRKRQGGSLLDPYASDDEGHLKDLAARLEEKYGQSSSIKPSKKKKQKLDDCIDRAAGYDESDSFIDNTDAYDEKIPKELQPACGGFYINSGQLDFKEVQVSEDDDEDDDTDDERGKTIVKSKSLKPTTTTQKEKVNKLTKMGSNSSPYPKLGDVITKKRKTSQDTPVSRPKPVGQSQKPKPHNLMSTTATLVNNNEASTSKKRPRQISSSSNSSSESSSSSSSDDSSTSTESVDKDKDDRKAKPKAKDGSSDIIILSSKAPPPARTLQKKPKKPPQRPIITDVVIKPTTLIPRKPRVKNVPLNPNLKRPDVPGALPINNTNTSPLPLPQPATITRKVLTPKDSIKSRSDYQGSKLSKNNNTPPPNKPPPQSSPSSVSSSPSPIGGNKTNPPTSIIKVPTPKSSSFNSTTLSGVDGVVTTTPTSQMIPKSSQLSLSSELAQLFSETPPRQNATPNSTSGSTTVTYCKTGQPPPPHQKTKSTLFGTSVAAESIANTSMVGSNLKADKSFTDIKKPLPKLKHKSGFPVEKQKPQSVLKSSPPSSFNAKPKKVNPQNIIVKPIHFSPTSQSQRVLSPQNATITPSSSFQSTSSLYNPGTIEITKVKKKTVNLPALGSGITVTEVRDKSAMTSANMGNSGMFGGSNDNSGKGPSFNTQRSPITVTPHHQSSNFTSVISNTTSTSSSSAQKVPHSVTISPSPLQNLTGDLSDRFNIGNFLVNKQNNKLPGFITSYDVSALLSSSTPLPDFPSSKTSSSDMAQVSSSSTNPKINRN